MLISPRPGLDVNEPTFLILMHAISVRTPHGFHPIENINGEWGWQRSENFLSLVQDQIGGLECLWGIYAFISLISSRE